MEVFLLRERQLGPMLTGRIRAELSCQCPQTGRENQRYGASSRALYESCESSLAAREKYWRLLCQICLELAYRGHHGERHIHVIAVHPPRSIAELNVG